MVHVGTSPVVQWLRFHTLPMQGAQVWSLVKELNPTSHNQGFTVHMPQLKILLATAEIWCSQINKQIFQRKERNCSELKKKNQNEERYMVNAKVRSMYMWASFLFLWLRVTNNLCQASKKKMHISLILLPFPKGRAKRWKKLSCQQVQFCTYL